MPSFGNKKPNAASESKTKAPEIRAPFEKPKETASVKPTGQSLFDDVKQKASWKEFKKMLAPLKFVLPSLPKKEDKAEEAESDAILNEIPGAQKTTRRGIIIIIVFVTIFIGWGFLFPLESASVAPGQITLDSYRKTIQHLEGGIVKTIYVRDGQHVVKDQPLIALQNVQSKSEYGRLKERYYKLQVREARLNAERNHLLTYALPMNLQNNIAELNSDELNQFIKTQQALFTSRQQTYESTLAIYDQKSGQLKQEISSLTSKVDSYDTQLKYIQEEISAMKQLLDKEYVSKVRYWSLLRSEADLKGKRDENTALISRTEQKLGETESQIVNFKNEWHSDVLRELSDVQVELADLNKQLDYAEDVDTRTVIRAPLDGTVEGLKIHTIGGVVRPMEDIMEIVPKKDELVIEARVDPLDIDIVHVGLEAKVYLSAYNIRHLPSIQGKVTYVSSDAFQDPNTNQSYYLARVVIDKDEMEKLGGAKLYPGMPAEVMIITDRQTFLGYLFKPVQKSFRGAFREK